MTKQSVFIDTSGFYALMDGSDRFNKEAGVLWSDLLEKKICLSTSNYIAVETMALVQNRLGFDAAVLWYKDILDLVEVLWVEETVHQEAYELLKFLNE